MFTDVTSNLLSSYSTWVKLVDMAAAFSNHLLLSQGHLFE